MLKTSARSAAARGLVATCYTMMSCTVLVTDPVSRLDAKSYLDQFFCQVIALLVRFQVRVERARFPEAAKAHVVENTVQSTCCVERIGKSWVRSYCLKQTVRRFEGGRVLAVEEDIVKNG